ncbi:prepilin [Salmonella enterica subsp. enterica serovar Rubislaw]|nr:prepilin [Salmonella enterica subsp. enterica serovar Rubislaw]
MISGQSGTGGKNGGKLKVTQLSTKGYLGQFNFWSIARMGNAEDAQYCQVVESPAGSRKWYKYEHKTGCIASCVTLN